MLFYGGVRGGVAGEGFRRVLDGGSVAGSSLRLVGEGFVGEGDGVERVEDKVAGSNAKGVKRVVRRRGANFVLSVDGKVQRRGRRRDGVRNGVNELLQRT